MITRVEGAPCWWLNYDGEGPHYATREEADKALGMPAGGVLLQLPVPCHTATCDRCGYGEGQNDSPWGYHFPAYASQHVQVDLEELRLDESGQYLLCPECRDAIEAAAGVAPLPGLEAVNGGGLR